MSTPSKSPESIAAALRARIQEKLKSAEAASKTDAETMKLTGDPAPVNTEGVSPDIRTGGDANQEVTHEGSPVKSATVSKMIKEGLDSIRLKLASLSTETPAASAPAPAATIETPQVKQAEATPAPQVKQAEAAPAAPLDSLSAIGQMMMASEEGRATVVKMAEEHKGVQEAARIILEAEHAIKMAQAQEQAGYDVLQHAQEQTELLKQAVAALPDDEREHLIKIATDLNDALALVPEEHREFFKMGAADAAALLGGGGAPGEMGLPEDLAGAMPMPPDDLPPEVVMQLIQELVAQGLLPPDKAQAAVEILLQDMDGAVKTAAVKSVKEDELLVKLAGAEIKTLIPDEAGAGAK